MKTIWKFPFEIASFIEVEMPNNPEMLHVELQGWQPCLWAIVDPDNEKRVFSFLLIGTGHPLPDNAAKHVGTFQQKQFVWHMFTVHSGVRPV